MVPRKHRQAWNTPHHAHALNFSTYRKQPFLLTPGVAEIFLKRLDEARHRFRFEIWAFVVMPDHVHILLKPQEEVYSMPDILKAIKSQAAKEIFTQCPDFRESCRVPRAGRSDELRFWQAGGGYDRNLVAGKAIWDMIHYIHIHSQQPSTQQTLRWIGRLAMVERRRVSRRTSSDSNSC